MEPNEFLKKVKELEVPYYRKKPKKFWPDELIWQPRQFGSRKKVIDNPPMLNDYLSCEWITGGISGGSCWDEDDRDSRYASARQKEPEFTDLDKVLTAFCPDIAFLLYKKLTADTIKYSDRTEHEYYGNKTEYGIKSVRLGDLYDKMKELKIL
jgi:hypothetical protein